MYTTAVPDTLANSVSHQFGIAARHVRRICAEQLAPAGDIDQAEWAVLAALSSNGTMACSPIADTIGIDKVKMSRAVTALQTAGLVSVVVSKRDGRRRMVSLTAKGRKVQEQASKAAQEADRQLAELLGDAAPAVMAAIRNLNQAAAPATRTAAEIAAERRAA